MRSGFWAVSRLPWMDGSGVRRIGVEAVGVIESVEVALRYGLDGLRDACLAS